MRRQRRTHNMDDDDYYVSSNGFVNGFSEDVQELQMDRLGQNRARRHENTIEARVEEGDTLQALALRFHCTVADIKRLNKIDKDNEIHARKVVKIPLTVHSILLGTIPTVHKSGNSSPNNLETRDKDRTRTPLEDASAALSEKLMVASVNASGETSTNNNINSVILNSKLAAGTSVYRDEETHTTAGHDTLDAEPLLADALDDYNMPNMRPIRGPAISDFDWSGSDCDMSWVCLFVVILAMCFVIPLVCVILLTEHSPQHSNSTLHGP